MDNLPTYILDAIRGNDELDERDYQKLAALQAYNTLQKENAEINLPPGTGKTLISQIIAILWLKENVGSKVLSILPSSILLDQHFDDCCRWAKYPDGKGVQGLCNPLKINSDWVNNMRINHENFFNKSDLWFSLPELLTNILSKRLIPDEAFNKISLVIIDEYDTFSLGLLRAEGVSTNFKKPFLALLTALKRLHCKYLLLSATPAS